MVSHSCLTDLTNSIDVNHANEDTRHCYVSGMIAGCIVNCNSADIHFVLCVTFSCEQTTQKLVICLLRICIRLKHSLDFGEFKHLTSKCLHLSILHPRILGGLSSKH
mmetsp:Transcript_12735/g.37475  ORF Transcript_12735/g.37475 Transcript_12735/m.37475 type:complete len:107 (-) Transcript_12735:3-323(-)